MTQIRIVYEKEPPFPATDQHPDARRFIITHDGTTLYADCIGEQPTQPEVDAFFAAPVPQTVTAFQAKAALLQAGLLNEVETLISGSPALTQLAWQQQASYNRDSPLLNQMAQALNLSSAQVDDLFRTAAEIAV